MSDNTEHFSLKFLIKASLLLFSGAAAGQLFPLLLSPILTRIYTPTQFGTFGQFLSIANVLSVIVTGQLEHAVMLPKNEKHAHHLVILTLITSLFNSLFFGTILFVGGKQICLWFHNRALLLYLPAAAVSAFLWGVLRAFTYWRNRYGEFATVSSGKALQGISTSLFQLSGGYIKSSSLFLITGRLVGQICNILILLKGVNLRDFFVLPATKRLKILLIKYKNFPLFNIPAAFLNILSAEALIFFLSLFFSSEIVGFYTVSQRFLAAPVSMVAMAVGQVFYKEAVKNKDSDIRLKRLIYNIYFGLMFAGLMPALILFMFGDAIFTFVWGKTWLSAGIFARILSIWLLIVLITSPVSLLFYVFEKQKQYFLFNFFTLLFQVIALIYASVIFRNPYTTAISFVGVSVISRLLMTFHILNKTPVNIYKIIYATLLFIFVPIIILLIFFYSRGHVNFIS